MTYRAVACCLQLLTQPIHRERLAGPKEKGVRRQVVGWGQPLQRCGCSDNKEIQLTCNGKVEAVKPLGDEVLMGRKGFVGKCFPVSETRNAKAWLPGFDFLQKPLVATRVVGYDKRKGTFMLTVGAFCSKALGLLLGPAGREKTLSRPDGKTQDGSLAWRLGATIELGP